MLDDTKKTATRANVDGVGDGERPARRRHRKIQADKAGRAKKRIVDVAAESGFLHDSIPTTLASHSSACVLN